MSKHSNLVTVYSPEGEPFETSTANARDLVTHALWSYTAPQGGVLAPVAPKEITDGESTVPPSEGGSPEGQAESEGSESANEGQGEGEEGGEKAVLTEADFDGKTRDEVADWLAVNYPDYHPHHKTGVDKLIAKAIELSTAE